ncbi:MAG: hypothetical protein EOO75_10655 [Myxococcales bacterium]|nr:MAG: hypothetical protein EOO75_10655 [Myxococcales bacterium]
MRLEPPLVPEDAPLCGGIAAPGADGATLAALVASWQAQTCGEPTTCGSAPGVLSCQQNKCALVDTCAGCPLTLDPVCTTSGMNALNTCFATECLQEPGSTPGYCPDTPACLAAGGTCAESLFTPEAPCPDGTRWDPADTSCPGGNVRTTCCVPWSAPCSYVSGSYTLSLDPTTCQPAAAPGAPWVCLHNNTQDSCTTTGPVENPFNPAYQGSFQLTAQTGSKVTVKGVQATTGRTFECTGTVSFDDTPTVWSCQGCAGGGGDCVTCEVNQFYGCML